MRNVSILPAWQPAAQLFPDRQEPDPGARGQCALREDGRKWMAGAVMWHQAPNHMKSLKRWTLRPLSDSKRVMWVSHATVPSKQQNRCPEGRYKNICQVPGAEVKTVQRLLICWVLWAQGWCSIRCTVTYTETAAAGVGRVPGWGRWQTVCSSSSSHPCCVSGSGPV